ncbi:MAG: (deoxy)nucleoside triphosphate pyrophosphohydrolase [Polyangiaceae bacterium]
MKRLHVVAAAIFRDGQVLAARRGERMREPLKWEFPGGKIESGEGAAEALKREIAEELRIEILVGARLGSSLLPELQLELFACQLESGVPSPTEHAELRWLTASELSELDWAPADVPLLGVVSGALRDQR